MTKRFISIALVILFAVSLCSIHATASESLTLDSTISKTNGATTQIVRLSDGSYLEIITTSYEFARGSNTKTGTKIYNKRDSSGTLEWKAVLTATFTYNGIIASCTNASCAVTIYNSSWHVVSKSTSCSGNTATAYLTMSYSSLGGTPIIYSYTITLSCDANGNLS